MYTQLKLFLIAAYQGGFRFLFISFIGFYYSVEASTEIAGSYSLFIILSTLLAVTPASYLPVVMRKKVSVFYYSLLSFFLGYLILIATCIILERYYEIGMQRVFLLLFSLYFWHMIVRNYNIYKKNYTIIIYVDVVFSILFFIFFICFNQMNISFNIYIPLLIVLLWCIYLWVVAFVKYKQELNELITALGSGVSNFVSGGVVFLLPMILLEVAPTYSYKILLTVSILSVLMLLPRMFLIKKTSSLVRSTTSKLALGYLKRLRSRNIKLLLISICLSFIIFFLLVIIKDIYVIEDIFIWCLLCLYFFFSQISLFDCNFLIYKGAVKPLLIINVICFLGFLFLTAIFLTINVTEIEKMYLVLSALVLPYLCRYFYIKNSICNYVK